MHKDKDSEEFKVFQLVWKIYGKYCDKDMDDSSWDEFMKDCEELINYKTEDANVSDMGRLFAIALQKTFDAACKRSKTA